MTTIRRKNMKKILVAVVLLFALCLSACGGKLIGKNAALDIALNDAGVEKSKAIDIDVELDSDRYNKWYEVDFDSGNLEFE